MTSPIDFDVSSNFILRKSVNLSSKEDAKSSVEFLTPLDQITKLQQKNERTSKIKWSKYMFEGHDDTNEFPETDYVEPNYKTLNDKFNGSVFKGGSTFKKTAFNPGAKLQGLKEKGRVLSC